MKGNFSGLIFARTRARCAAPSDAGGNQSSEGRNWRFVPQFPQHDVALYMYNDTLWMLPSAFERRSCLIYRRLNAPYIAFWCGLQKPVGDGVAAHAYRKKATNDIVLKVMYWNFLYCLLDASYYPHPKKFMLCHYVEIFRQQKKNNLSIYVALIWVQAKTICQNFGLNQSTFKLNPWQKAAVKHLNLFDPLYCTNCQVKCWEIKRSNGWSSNNIKLNWISIKIFAE